MPRRLATLLAFLLAPAPPACSVPRTPVWFVPANAPISRSTAHRETIAVLRGLGYNVASIDPNLQLVTTEWRYHDTLFLSRRHRVLVRINRGDAAGISVSVPTEYYDGARWRRDGEDETRRKELVATLVARLSRGARAEER